MLISWAFWDHVHSTPPQHYTAHRCPHIAVARNEVIVRSMGATEGFSLCELELPGARKWVADGRHGGSKGAGEK